MKLREANYEKSIAVHAAAKGHRLALVCAARAPPTTFFTHLSGKKTGVVDRRPRLYRRSVFINITAILHFSFIRYLVAAYIRRYPYSASIQSRTKQRPYILPDVSRETNFAIQLRIK